MTFFKISCLLFLLVCKLVIAQENINYERAYASYENGNIDETYIFLKNSLKDNPNHLPSKMLMAEVLALSGYFGDASVVFEESIAEGADLNLVIESYIRVLLTLREYGKVLDLPEAQLTPIKKGFLRSAKASAYSSLNDMEKAEEFHEKAYQIAPTSINVLSSAIRFYLSTNKDGLAKTRLDQSLAVNPNISTTYELLSQYYARLGNKEKQIEALEKGLSITETHPVILRELVSAYAEQGDFTQAKKVLTTTLEVSPNDPMASLLLSWIAAQLGESDLSTKTLTSLVNQLSLLDSDELTQQDYMLFVSALANYAANNIEIARGQLEQYVNRNPNNFEASKLLADIHVKDKVYLSAASLLEAFPDQINADVTLIAQLCDIYIKARQNHKCNSLLLRNRIDHGSSPIYVQTESNLLAARGKLDLALENLNKIQSTQLSVLAQKAVIAIQDNQLDVASSTVQKLIELAPTNSDFLNLKASILKKQGDFVEAEQIYREALKIKPDHYAANFNLTHIYYLTGRLQVAKSNVLNLLEKRFNDVDLLLLQSNILIAMNEYDTALDSLSLAEALTRNDAKVEEVFIRLYTATDQYEKALFRVNKLLKDDLTDVNLLRKRAEFNFKLGNIPEAHKDLRIIFGLLTDDSQSLYELSTVQSQFADTDGAYKTIKQAYKLNPSNLYINRNLSKLALIKNDIITAENRIDWLKVVAPNDPDVLMLQGDLALTQEEKDAAATFYLKAIKSDGTLGPALIAAYQLAKTGIKQKEFGNIFKTLASEPETNTFATHLYADFLFSQKKYDDAKNAYISISGQNSYLYLPAVLNNLANIYVKENKIDAAHNFAQQAYELQPKDDSILDTIGWISVLRGNNEQGLSLLREAYAMNAQDPNLRYHIAYVLNKLGRSSESQRELKVLLSDFPDFANREKALALKEALLQ